jgi:MAF protein
MNQRKFWLASNSPRRREFLSWVDWDVESVSSVGSEARLPGEDARSYVRRLAGQKSQMNLTNANPNDFIISADTVVVFSEEIIGKPRDKAHAFAILSNLRGRSHEVITAVACRHVSDGQAKIDLCVSPVRMRDYSDGEIEAYIQTGDPMDKAGAYAIQDPGFHPAAEFTGCFASVMGLPLCHLERTLRTYDNYEMTDWPKICQTHLKYDCPITARVMRGEDIG